MVWARYPVWNKMPPILNSENSFSRWVFQRNVHFQGRGFLTWHGPKKGLRTCLYPGVVAPNGSVDLESRSRQTQTINGFSENDPCNLVGFVFQEAIVKIMKMRKRITNAALQTELVEILKNMFIPQKKMIKEQIEWLIDHKYLRRDEEDINTFLYVV